MKIKPIGYKVIDEETGIAFELIPKTEDASPDLVDKFFNSFKVLKAETQEIEPLKQKRKRLKKPKQERARAKKKVIPSPLQRLIKELTDLPEEFILSDIGDLFEKEGYDRKMIIRNAYHDINDLSEKKRIMFREGTKPKKFKIESRDTSDLE